MDGWLLLHKKILENEIIRGNPNALAVWIWLLVHCRDGQVTCGRYQVATELGIKPHTVRYWLSRFCQADIMLTTIKTTNKNSTYYICNWDKYQKKTTNGTSGKLQANFRQTSTNKQQAINNKQDLLKTKQVSLTPRNIFLSLKDLSDFEKDFSTKNVQLEFEKAKDWLLSTGKVYKDYTAFFRGWLRRSDDKKVARPMLVIGRKS